ncbi:Aste57867_4752 [Aphanomyces stellatus]|uniref:Aste57867_4752 protein n=1 Tax=Aphanomyces stellatus TaxID=120398 RepID=A0A485KGV5_9STRA|nr:hypothetical protein As57867_004739 [Aphanomyces stellatus]VFT81848.1 Aste57867_4752 [Aphanomyces stellatus]
MLRVHVSGAADAPAFQQTVSILEGLSIVHDLRLDVQITPCAPLAIQLTTAHTSTTCTSLDSLLALLRQHVQFTAPASGPAMSLSPPPPSSLSPLNLGGPSSIRVNGAGALRIFVAGDKSQVGKSTICLGLLGSLLELGYKPHELAYIKPATQCEESQLVGRFCAHHGIAARPIGPVVFYSGFTRAFLEQPDAATATADLLHQVVDAVEAISASKRIVIIDGVGYPSVGSICGVSNADIAAALQPISVVVVGKKGVGDAVDSFNLNASYFTHQRGVRVLGGIFNRLPPDGYYSLPNCAANVTRYFELHYAERRQKAYGFVPDIQWPSHNPTTPLDDVALWTAVLNVFPSSVDVAALVDDAKANVGLWTQERSRKRPLADKTDDVLLAPIPIEDFTKKPRRELTIQWQQRQHIQAEAKQLGAAGS